MEKWIDLDKLPKINNEMIDWKKSIGMVVNFKYNTIRDNVKIIDFKNSIITIYNPKYGEFKINSGNFKKCTLGKFLNIYTDTFRIEIGENFKDANRDITIIDRKYETIRKEYFDKKRNKIRVINKKEKYYKYRCNKDNFENWILESNLLKGVGCSLCTNTIIVKGKNDIATTRPDLVKYFNSVEDAYKYAEKSHERLLFKCPYCNTTKEMRIADFVIKGFSCPICNDGFSYPEKFMHSLLTQSKIKFIHQLSSVNFSWIGSYRYDFYLINFNTIIEVHGDQHYNARKSFSKRNPRQEQDNDRKKYELAKNNGISKYITNDASISSIDWLKKSIMESDLSSIINLDDINWIKCETDARKSKIYEICEIKRKNPRLTSKEISDISGIERSVIVDYLKLGNRLNWCNYSAKEEQRLSAQRNRPRKAIIVKNENGETIGIFDSCSELERQSVKLFGFKMHFTEVAKRVNPKSNKYKTKYHEYIIEEKK